MNSWTPQKWSEIETDPAGSDVIQFWYRDASRGVERWRMCRDVERPAEQFLCLSRCCLECLECLKTVSYSLESIFPHLRPKECTLKGKWRTHSFVPLLMVGSHTACWRSMMFVTSHSHFWWKCLYNSERNFQNMAQIKLTSAWGRNFFVNALFSIYI